MVLVPDSWVDPLKAFTNYLIVAGYSFATINTRYYQLSQLARAFPQGVETASEDLLISWLAAQPWKAETRHNSISAIKVFFQWSTRTGLCETDPSKSLPSVKRPKRAARPVADEVWLADRERAPYRLKLIIDLAALLGLRRCEIARINSDDVTKDTTGWNLLVHGKGSKERILPITESMAERLSWKQGWVFPSHPDNSKHITPGHIGKMIKKLTDGRWTLHQLRHRFGTTIWQQTHDLLTVQTLLGHESPDTTQIYIAFPDDRLREVIHLAAPSRT